MKTKFIFSFYLFIMITLVSLHNIHVLNYTRNILKNCIPNTKKHSQAHFQGLLPNTGK